MRVTTSGEQTKYFAVRDALGDARMRRADLGRSLAPIDPTSRQDKECAECLREDLRRADALIAVLKEALPQNETL